jgi:O-acetylhomoserine (thiol)-lyase
MHPFMKISTLVRHGAIAPEIVNSPASLPIYQSAAWEFATLKEAERVFTGALPGAVYGTRGVPNVSALETAIAELEGADGAVITSGGSAAIFASLQAHLRPGDHVVAGIDLFGGTLALLRAFERWGVDVRLVDLCDTAHARAVRILERGFGSVLSFELNVDRAGCAQGAPGASRRILSTIGRPRRSGGRRG